MRLGLSAEISGAHMRHEPGKTGLFDIINSETAVVIKPIMDQFQIDWEITHEGFGIDVRQSTQGAHIQDLYNALDKVGRESILERLPSRKKESK